MSTGWGNLYHRKPELGCCEGFGTNVHISELSMTRGHTISAEADCASAEGGEIKHTQITPTSSSHPLTNPAQGGARNHLGNINACGSCYGCPPLHTDSGLKRCPPTTLFSKPVGNGSSDNGHHSASHLLLPAHSLRQPRSSTRDCLWWRSS